MSKRKGTKKECDLGQFRSPSGNHNCKNCTSFSIEDLQEFYRTLTGEAPAETWDKKELCKKLRTRFSTKEMNHLNRLLDEKRYFRSKLVILHNDLFPTDVLKEIEKHQIKDQDFGIYSDAVAAIVKQIDFIQDELARNHIQFVFRDVEGNFHFLMDDMKALVQEGELTLPNHLWIYFDTYYIGRIDFGVERKDRAPRAAERSLLTDLNGKAGTFEVSASEMIPKKETDTLEHARKYLIDQLKLIKAKFPLYVLIKNAPVPVDDEFLNLIVANTLPNKPRTFYISREREITFIIQKLDRVPRTDLTVNPNQEAAQWYFKSKDQ